MSTLLAAWTTLSEDDQPGTGLLGKRLQIAAPCGIIAAIERPSGRRALLLEVHPSAIPAGLRFPIAAGFEVDVRPVQAHPSQLISVALLAQDTRHNSLFAALASDVIDFVTPVATQKDCIRMLMNRLELWQGFFRHARPEGLSENAQRGLFAELWFLQRHAMRCLTPPDALRAWTGPRGASQDFQFPPSCVEVKSSASQPSARIHISNARQLDATGIPALYLHVSLMDIRVSHGLSLTDLIDSINMSLTEQDASAQHEFVDLLLQLGYEDIQRDLYRNARYIVRQELLYEVRDTFPRLVEADLRTGVGNLKYTVDLSACEPFRHPLSDIDALLRPALNVS